MLGLEKTNIGVLPFFFFSFLPSHFTFPLQKEMGLPGSPFNLVSISDQASQTWLFLRPLTSQGLDNRLFALIVGKQK